MKVFLLFLLIAALIVFMPLVAIWSLNTLFGLGIAYTFKTWCAAVILCGCITGSGSYRK